MNNILNLAKTFIKASSMSEPTDKGQKIKIAVLSIFSVLFIMIPVVVAAGVFVKIMTESLQLIDCERFGIQLMLYIVCFFSMIFGINILFSELYFANDIEHILPWPLRAYEIVGAKFIAVFYMENIMQFMLIISCIIGYGIGAEMGIGRWIISIIGMFVLPIVPLAYCGIISIIIMGFTRLIRKKDIIQKASIALVFILLIILVASIGSLQSLDLSKIIENMALGNKTGIKVLNIIFPNVSLYVNAVSKGSIVSLIVYIAVNVLAVVIMLVLAELLYFKGLIGLTSSTDKHKVKELSSLLSGCKQHSSAYAYFMKEIRNLVRTPAYFTNCVMINFIWPIFVYAVYKIKGFTYSIEQLEQIYRNNDYHMQQIVLLGVIGISVIVTALNSISSNSFSREGKHFSFMKYIPVPYKVQWTIKAVVGAIFPIVGVLIFFIPACIVVNVPVLHIVMYTFLSIIAIIFVSFMGVYIDSIQPKLVWEDELNSLRENYNTFFAMAIAIGFVGVVCIGGFFVLKNINIWLAMLVILGVIAVCNMIVMYLSMKWGEKNIEEQEEM